MTIGICTQKFPLQGKWLGDLENSIGIFNKGGICIDGTGSNLESAGIFKEGDVIGLGIIHYPTNSSMKSFATRNGELMGKNI